MGLIPSNGSPLMISAHGFTRAQHFAQAQEEEMNLSLAPSYRDNR
jgi:hypothetical protein